LWFVTFVTEVSLYSHSQHLPSPKTLNPKLVELMQKVSTKTITSDPNVSLNTG